MPNTKKMIEKGVLERMRGYVKIRTWLLIENGRILIIGAPLSSKIGLNILAKKDEMPVYESKTNKDEMVEDELKTNKDEILDNETKENSD